jgi:hypothetical protein
MARVTDLIHHKYNIKRDVIEIPNATRDDLAQLFHDLDFKVGAEIGVAAGEYSKVIMENNPQLEKMYGVDPYLPYKDYKDYVRTSTFQTLLDEAKSRLDQYPAYEFIREMSVEASKDFEDGSLDFVYIDANHQEKYAYEDIAAWAPKVKAGGVVAGHDYARLKAKNGEDSTNWAVIPAVHRYVKENGYQLYIWGLEAKLPGLKRDAVRSWMFEK